MNWEVRSLGDWGIVAESGFASGKHNASGTGVIHLRPMNIDRAGRLDFTQVKSVAPDTSSKRIEPGDVLFNNTNSPELVGKTTIFEHNSPLAFSNHMTRIRIPTSVDPRYLATLLHSYWQDGYFKQICSNHVNQASVSNKRLLQVEVALPPLDIQKRIVEALEDHLSRLEKALDFVDSAKHHVQALVRSKRHEVFAPESLPHSWKYVPISSVLTALVGKRLTQRGWSPQCLNHTKTSNFEWGVLKTTAIQFGEYQPQHHKQLPVSLEAKPEIEVEPGDLIMTATGPRNRCGIPCLVEETPSRLMMSGKMFRFRTDSSICDSRWLLQFLLSDAGQRQLEKFKVGSSDSSVSIGSQQFENIELPLPPISVQTELLSQLDELTSRAKHFELALGSTGSQAELLRRSILHAAFTGQLTKEDSND